MLITEFATVQLRGGDTRTTATIIATMIQITRMMIMATITAEITRQRRLDSRSLQLSTSQH